jgi:L-asparaginase
MQIEIMTTGGTIDKVYFDAKSTFQVGEPQIAEVLHEANLTIDYQVTPLMQKDSLEMTPEDRNRIRLAVEATDAQRVIITHGTDTMIETGKVLQNIPGKTIILTGSMQPARFRTTDAIYNIASAVTAVQLLPAGVFIVMNGRVFDPLKALKNVAENRFEPI